MNWTLNSTSRRTVDQRSTDCDLTTNTSRTGRKTATSRLGSSCAGYCRARQLDGARLMANIPSRLGQPMGRFRTPVSVDRPICMDEPKHRTTAHSLWTCKRAPATPTKTPKLQWCGLYSPMRCRTDHGSYTFRRMGRISPVGRTRTQTLGEQPGSTTWLSQCSRP